MNPQLNDSADIGKQKGSIRPLVNAIFSVCVFSMSFAPFSAMAATPRYLASNAPDFISAVVSEYGDIIKIASLLQDYDEKMILSVIVIESEGKVGAVSHQGAQGLMQLMPATAKSLGVTDPHDPFQNVLAGTRYLKELQTRYGFKTPQEALVAYNMGPTRAKRWLSQYDAEDYLYVQKVMYVHGVLTAQEQKERQLAKNDVEQVTSSGDQTVSLKPLLTRPRTIALASFPLVINDRRQQDVTEE